MAGKKGKKKKPKPLTRGMMSVIAPRSDLNRAVRMIRAIEGEKTDWVDLFRMGADKCTRCGEKENLTVHHLTKRSQGGEDRPGNLDILCARCHQTWHDLEICQIDYHRFTRTTPGGLERLVEML